MASAARRASSRSADEAFTGAPPVRRDLWLELAVYDLTGRGVGADGEDGDAGEAHLVDDALVPGDEAEFLHVLAAKPEPGHSEPDFW